MPSDVVNSFIAAMERKDLEHACSHLTDDCEYDNVPMGKVFGRNAVQDILGPFLSRFDEIAWPVSHQVATGTLDHGVVMNERVDRFRAGTQWIEMPVAGLFIIRHGQIALWRDYFDRDTYVKAVASLS
jgi:limonene-1,2-epoxide hydrolase